MNIITKTPRLLIQEANVNDTAFFLELLNTPSWIKFIGDRGVKTKKQAQDYIQNSLVHSYETNGFGLFKMVLRATTEPIGICGFIQRDYLDHPDIGFAILPAYEGQGYTYEACSSLMEYAKQELNIGTILGITTPTNTKSQNLLAKIGLLESGKVIPPGKKEELLLFSNKKSHP
ncbi:MAG: GNAT family N-acetyltransferase [Bacteroidota bacterium]